MLTHLKKVPDASPCPWCGRRDVSVEAKWLKLDFEYGPETKVTCRCDYCGAASRIRVVYDDMSDAAEIAFVQSLWNDRALPEDVKEVAV